MPDLVLVRHARVVRAALTPAADWPLSDAGRADAAVLAWHPALTNVRAVYTSPEAKAVATAEIVAGDHAVVVVPDLRELDRSAAGWLAGPSDYRALVLDVLAHPGETVRGCEAGGQAQKRVVQAIERIVGDAGEQPVAVVSHGIALTLYLSHLLGRRLPDPAIWDCIGMPDLAVVDPQAGRIVEPFAGPRRRGLFW